MSLCGILLKGLGAPTGLALASPTLALADNGDGSLTATITGSTAGTTNTLYFQAVQGQLGGSTWMSAGSRSGDGTLTATIAPGYYWWYVASTLAPDEAVSNMVYQNVINPSDSVHDQCCRAVQATIQSLGLAGVANSSVVIKKLALQRFLGSLRTLGVPLPAVVILPEPEQQDPARGVNGLDDVVYPVTAVFIQTDNQEPTVAANLATVLGWRQKLNRAFRQQRLAGADDHRLHGSGPDGRRPAGLGDELAGVGPDISFHQPRAPRLQRLDRRSCR